MLPLILVIGGFVVILIGIVVTVRPPGAPRVGQPESVADLAQVVAEVRALLLIFGQQVRTGLLIVLIGLALVMAGVFVETR